MPGWGDHLWGPDPWGGQAVVSPIFDGGFIIAWDEAAPDEVIPQPPRCRAHGRIDLCDLFPKKLCQDDTDPDKGGTGDHHRLLQVIHDWMFGNNGETGLADNARAVLCILNHHGAPDRYLSARLRHLGFDLELPLTVDQKRILIPLLVKNIYKQKGSKASLEEAFRLLTGIPVEIIVARGEENMDEGLECGEDYVTTLSAVTAASSFVQVSDPNRFEIGKDLVIIDRTAPHVTFLDTEILNVVSDRVYFAPQSLTGTIELGAAVFCSRYFDQLEHDILDLGGYSRLGADLYVGSTPPSLWTFYVDVQRTVQTTTPIDDGGNQVTLTDASFVIKGSRIRITDLDAPINDPIVLAVTEVVGNDVLFDPVSLDYTVEAGAEVLNLFSQEQITLFDEITKFIKWDAEFHYITRDRGTAPVEIG